jgi:hypothetical protein
LQEWAGEAGIDRTRPSKWIIVFGEWFSVRADIGATVNAADDDTPVSGVRAG